MADHVDSKSTKMLGLSVEKEALVIKDVMSGLKNIYPIGTKSADDAVSVGSESTPGEYQLGLEFSVAPMIAFISGMEEAFTSGLKASGSSLADGACP